MTDSLTRLMDLGGQWRAVTADEPLRRVYPEPEYDDSGWSVLDVPGHWRSHPDFADADGPLLLRHRFEADTQRTAGRRRWLTFDGVFYQADVWLDGSYVGDTEGYFFPHTFEATDALAAQRDHVLAVEVTCSPPSDRTAKRNLTGVFEHGDDVDPAWNPGGIWRPVHIQETGPVRIARLRIQCGEASADRAVLALRAILDASGGGRVAVRTTVDGQVEADEEHVLAAGENRVEWRVDIDGPRLWWPHQMGDPTLVDVIVEIRPLGDDVDGTVSDARTVATGLRQVSMTDWVVSVNGERLFVKGANQGPIRQALADATPAEFDAVVASARDAGLDLLRVRGHISRTELYEAADRAGLLLWQDLPLQWGYARTVRRQAVRQAREAVDLLGHHPSIVLWCAHNEPSTNDATADERATPRAPFRVAAALARPRWNRTVLDSSIRRALEKADKSRPVVAHSGVPAGDSHLWFGWFHGDERDLPDALASWPRLGRFVSEFGAHSVPDSDAFLDPSAWPDLDWDRLKDHHGLDRVTLARHGLDPAGFSTLEAWRDATQRYQASVLRHHIETLRRLKYRPAGGFAMSGWADGRPAVSWSAIDHEGVPKKALDAVRAACAPVIVVAERPEVAYLPGWKVDLDVHVVSDRRDDLDALVVEAWAEWDGGEVRRQWSGTIPADDCVRVGTLDFVTPDVPGPLRIEVRLRGAGISASNTYDTEIVAAE